MALFISVKEKENEEGQLDILSHGFVFFSVQYFGIAAFVALFYSDETSSTKS